MNLRALLPPKSRIRYLPSKNPRLYLSGSTPFKRWQESSLYPAFRRSAKIYRLFLRLKATIGLSPFWINDCEQWVVKSFVENIIPNVSSVVILTGAPGPAQKIILQLWDEQHIIGYLKYGEKPAARARIEREYSVLKTLPTGLGPIPLKCGVMGKGVGLLVTPVPGKQLQAKLPPDNGLIKFFEKLVMTTPIPIEEHPWVIQFKKQYGGSGDEWFEALSTQQWPVVCYHGDAAPWNIFRTSEGTMQAIDWEYGAIQGLPYLDVAQHVLQVAALIYQWSPEVSSAYAVKFLCDDGLVPEESQAEAIVGLAAYYGYMQSHDDGLPHNTRMQVWRRAVWEGLK